LEIDAAGVPQDVSRQLIEWFRGAMPQGRQRGAISIQRCSEAEIEVECDYFMEHDDGRCVSGFYTIEHCRGNTCWQNPIPDERVKACALDAA